MNCCGNQRRLFRYREVETPSAPISFEYTGKTSAVVIGGATGKSYSFKLPGARVEADPRDVRSLQTVPILRQIIR